MHIGYDSGRIKLKDHVLAIKGSYFGNFLEKGTMGYTQNCEIWHGASLGILIMIQEEPI